MPRPGYRGSYLSSVRHLPPLAISSQAFARDKLRQKQADVSPQINPCSPWLREDMMKQNAIFLLVGPNHDSYRKKKQDARARIDAAIKAALNQPGCTAEQRGAFQRLLACLRGRTGLLKPTPGQGSAGWIAPVFLIERLRNLAGHHREWLRPCETWCSPGGNLRPVFRSLAAHLLAFYPLPGFMDSAWDLPAGTAPCREQDWYIRLGRGAKLRELDIPIPLTRQMEHYVRQAPDHYTVGQALRYGEMRGLGGSKALAHEIALGRLGRDLAHAEFWRTVLWFFRQNPDMPVEHANPIIDFIHAQKFGGDEVVTEHGLERPAAPCPEFSMQGRTVNSLLRRARAWHGDLAKKGPTSSFSWARSGIREYEFLQKRLEPEENRLWIIRELLNSHALYDEGQAMHHCVYAYATLCWRRQTTIWSLRLRIKDHEKRIATIEVNPRKRAIVQARGKCNANPGGNVREIMRQWAAWAGLQIYVH